MCDEDNNTNKKKQSKMAKNYANANKNIFLIVEKINNSLV